MTTEHVVGHLEGEPALTVAIVDRAIVVRSATGRGLRLSVSRAQAFMALIGTAVERLRRRTP